MRFAGTCVVSFDGNPSLRVQRFTYSFRNTSSIFSANASAMRNASGRDGSNLPFSTALIELRETPTWSARSAWLQPFSALRTRMRFFMSGVGSIASQLRLPPHGVEDHRRDRLQHDDAHEPEHHRKLDDAPVDGHSGSRISVLDDQ